jgi:tagaturonate reductase
MERRLGYRDELMIMSEPYRLWAIETSRARTKQILSFSEVNSGVVITPDISKFRELKLRLLNGTHTFACALALLSGFATVKEAMQDENFSRFVSALMLQEIAPLVSREEGITTEEAYLFSQQVLDRFRNPYIAHPWISISVQYTSKILMRCIPLIGKHYSTSSEAPVWMSLGFAAYLLFTRPSGVPGEQYYTDVAGKTYPVQDDKAGILYEHWHSEQDMEKALRAIVSDVRLYGQDLAKYPHFTEAVQMYLAALVQQGAEKTLQSGILKQMTA